MKPHASTLLRALLVLSLACPWARAGEQGVIHSTIVSGTAESPLHKDPIEVRPLDTILGTKGTFGYIYNVQPQKRPEFAKGSASKFKYSDEWTLAEWFVDHATQTYRL